MPRRPTKKSLFGEWKPKPRTLAGKTHDLLMKLEPSFEAAPAWNGVGYKHRGNYSVLIAPYSDHVKLMIWRGIELDDPEGVLQGSGKNTRHLRIETASDLKRKVLAGFLAQQQALYAAGMTPEKKPRTRRAGKMPDDVGGELDARGLREAFDARPPYQRRDYVAWIASAKRDATRARRLEQMLAELEAGDVYMKMPWGGGSK